MLLIVDSVKVITANSRTGRVRLSLAEGCTAGGPWSAASACHARWGLSAPTPAYLNVIAASRPCRRECRHGQGLAARFRR